MSEIKISSTGAIEGLIHRGINLLAPARDSFSLALLDKHGKRSVLSSSDFTCESDENFIRFSQHRVFHGLELKLGIRKEGQFFFFRPEARGIPDGYILEWIDAPQIHVPKEGSIFSPFGEGVIVTKPESRETHDGIKYHPLGYPERGRAYGGLYPGCCQMQFMAYYNDFGGVYFAAHDPRHGTKAVEYAYEENGCTRFSLQTFCSGVRDYVSDFEYALGTFEGNWMDACEIYRDWMEPPTKPTLPEWFEDSPVILIYPVRGRGDDRGTLEPNEYFPYSDAMPYVRKYAREFDSRVMPLLMHWEGTAPWAPPYVWPPFGGEDLLSEFRDNLHNEGHLLGVYCSGTAWTQTSSITDYSREEKCRTEGLEKYMIRGPEGEIDAAICNGADKQRLGYDLCLAEEWSRRTIKNEIRELAEFKLDYAQFFDQNQGGAFHLCYSREHHHPNAPGAWQTDTMTSLLRECRDEIADAESDMLLGCEGAAAEPYINTLPFSDDRVIFTYGYGMPVPAYAYVFHEYVNNFMGNQVGIKYHMNLKESPENLLYRVAYAFNAGDLLSVVLKDSGKIHWGWLLDWDYPEPDQESVIKLIKNLNDLRKRYPEFLRHGKMIKPLNIILGEDYRLQMVNRVEYIKSFLESSWKSPDGLRAQIITNFQPREQRVEVAGKSLDLAPLNAVVLDLHGEVIS